MTELAHAVAEVTPGPSVVTIGNFDGVHRGHHVLLRRVVDLAHDRGLRPVAVTFDPHPAAVVRPGAEPPRLQTLDERVAMLHATGIELVLVLTFTPQLAALTPEAFVQQVLGGPLQARRVVVGTNFRFGQHAAGDVATLVELGRDLDLEVEAVPLLEIDGERLSSSLVRRHLVAGQVEGATAALGRPYTVRGRVVAGDGRGRTIGVPTANLKVAADVLLPGDGVYAGWAHRGTDRWRAVTNVGMRPTFDGSTRTVETHLLDADVDLYDAQLQVEFSHRVRGEQRFEGPDELVAQIRRDIAAARAALDPAG